LKLLITRKASTPLQHKCIRSKTLCQETRKGLPVDNLWISLEVIPTYQHGKGVDAHLFTIR